ncbi:hypothetical protein [Pseudanabaena mucicola]|uniref:hypothetical protein n=1 Tax=Pseudanabaena mucicola TaxID=71190 RepID=UPI002576BE58|nr:hypothetical protein [Pseudanabaena mucicola]
MNRSDTTDISTFSFTEGAKRSKKYLAYPVSKANNPSNNNQFIKKDYENTNIKPLPSRIAAPVYIFKNLKQKEFVELAAKWKEETAGSSSLSKKLLNLSYLRIISMGEIVVPLILQELKHSPDHWFIALKAITNADPVSDGASFNQAVDDWLKWGKSKGLID